MTLTVSAIMLKMFYCPIPILLFHYYGAKKAICTILIRVHILYDGPIFMGESRKGFEADLSFSQTSTPSLSASVLKLTTYSYLEQKIVKLKLLHSNMGSLSGMVTGTPTLLFHSLDITKKTICTILNQVQILR